MIGTPELILIVLALVLLFGAKKIPELMKKVSDKASRALRTA